MRANDRLARVERALSINTPSFPDEIRVTFVKAENGRPAGVAGYVVMNREGRQFFDSDGKEVVKSVRTS